MKLIPLLAHTEDHGGDPDGVFDVSQDELLTQLPSRPSTTEKVRRAMTIRTPIAFTLILGLAMLPADATSRDLSKGAGGVESFPVASVQSTPPPLPPAGVQVLVGDDPRGAFAGHESQIARSTGAGWSFLSAGEGALAFDAGRDTYYLHVGPGLGSGALWPGSEWRLLAGTRTVHDTERIATDTTIVPAELSYERIYLVDTGAGDVTLTLPFADQVEGAAVRVVKTSADANTVTVEVDSGGTINGAPSLTILGQFGSAHLAALSLPGAGGWISF